MPNMSLRDLSQRRQYVLIALAAGVTLVVFWLFRIKGDDGGYEGIAPAVRNLMGSGSAAKKLEDDVFNTTLGFESIFVINLPSRTDRRDGMALSASLSDLKIEFIDGVLGEAVTDKALPPGGAREHLREGEVGCWRAHMNALQAIIQRNLSSALILEDDADWDVRIRTQFHDLALSALALTQPLSHSPSRYADPTYPSPPDGSAISPPVFPFDFLPSTLPPTKSPYGHGWDIIWVGHCGMRFPSSPNTPKGRVIRSPDPTVPEHQYLRTLAEADDLKSEYPPHTRVVHHAAAGICSLGYAVSHAGARRLLHSIGLKKMSDPYDLALRQFCDDSTGDRPHNCLTVQPPLFKHHRPVGRVTGESDISDHGAAYREKASTDVIRWSTRLNWDILLAGRTDFVDQYPDSS